MSWWTPSWLPTLPSIDFSLPSSIQKRFLSFALRQTLGHLLKPGQLDIQQVDSQIGSGFVQIRDVELDNNAINALIAGLPIQLHDGSVGKVTARIPWPNPLTSTVGLSLESLHLTFIVEPTISPDAHLPTAADVAESVASVAETFIHDELDAQEEAELFGSFHPELEASTDSVDPVPGGLDPFLGDGERHGEHDPPGISIFATLVERLLSRFQFDATDIKITLVHREHASFTLSVPSIRYGTEVREDTEKGPQQNTPTDEAQSRVALGVTRSVSISGVTLTTRCLRPPSPEPMISSFASTASSTHHGSASSTISPTSPLPPSPLSDSDIDEETTMLMSQSLAGLPPRPVSPASSVASSMYQSAVSTASMVHSRLPPAPLNTPPSPLVDVEEPTQSTQASVPPSTGPPRLGIITNEIEDEMLLSFGVEPIVVRLSTPVAVRSRGGKPCPEDQSTDSTTSAKAAQRSPGEPEAIKLNVSIGVIAVGLRARHIRTLLDVAQLWSIHTPEPKSPAEPKEPGPSRPFAEYVDISVHLRGVAMVLLPASFGQRPLNTHAEFFKHPLAPPRLSHGYVRLHLDELSTSVSIRPTPGPPSLRHTIPGFSGSTITATVSLTELSAFAFVRRGPSTTDELYAFPLLITDPNLPLQYDTSHVHPDLHQPNGDADLPAFDIIDWTDEANWTSSAKLSLWRTKLPQGRPASIIGQAGGLGQSPRHSPSTSPRVAMGTSPRRAGQVPPLAQRSAVVIKLTMSIAPAKQQTRRKGKEPASGVTVDVDVAPLHIFADLAAILGDEPNGVSETLCFVEELTASDITPLSQPTNEDASDDEVEDDDAETPPATPRARQNFFQRQQELDRERERKRLEKLVMDDLDLEYDYGQVTSEPKRDSKGSHRKRQHPRNQSSIRVSCNFPAIRVELRAAQKSSGKARSGAVVIDMHDIVLFSGQSSQGDSGGGVHFAGAADPTELEDQTRRQDAAPLLTARWQRFVVAYSTVGESRAKSILSLGPLPPIDRGKVNVQDGSPVPRTASLPQQTKPQIAVSQSTSGTLSTLILAVEIPSVYVKLAKDELDGLQIWADELSKLLEASSQQSRAGSQHTSRDPSLIGSRYFSRSQRHDSNESDSVSAVSAQPADGTKETIAKVSVIEAAAVVLLPRRDSETASTRPFKIMASDVDLLLELKPEGKDETVVTLGVMDLNVVETSPTDAPLTFLSLTMPRSVIEPNQSLLKIRFKSFVVPGTTAKESRVKVTLCGVTYTVHPNLQWITDLAAFAKAPPGVFENVTPSERTSVSVKIVDTSVRALCPTFPGALVLYIGEAEFATTLIGNIPEMSFNLSIQSLALFLIDDLASSNEGDVTSGHLAGIGRLSRHGGGVWKALGYALLLELSAFDMKFHKLDYNAPPDVRILVERGNLRLHLCADTGTALGGFISDFASLFASKSEADIVPVKPRREPTEVARLASSQRDLLASVDDEAFRRCVPDVGAADMVDDDLPSNLDYLDESFSATAGLRPIDDEEFEDEFVPEYSGGTMDQEGVVGVHGGETIRLLDPTGLHIKEHHFDTLPPDSADESTQYGETTLKVRAHDCEVTVFLYDGYDWARTRRIIEEKAKEMRRRLARIRQLVANGQTPDPSVEETNTLLFNSVYIGIEHNIDEVEPAALMAEIDEELNEDAETASQSSWQSFKPQQLSPGSPRSVAADHETRRARRKLSRSKGPSIEFRLQGLDVEVDNYRSHPSLASRTLATVTDVEILDHIKTSTWSKFLTSLRADSRGNIRETDSNMVRVELRKVYPVEGNPAEEARLRAKILPLRLHVDQDALDFLKKFFSFKDPEAVPAPSSEPADEIFFQQVEVFPVDLKLDYKPRRVDYRALRDGRTIELMNFFHFDGAEMTLRHITLTGITGWAKVGDLLNDLWTPDVKATQLVEVISGVAPIRSVVNVGSGVADLVLLPIAQYKKDGRVVRGLQKGTTAFVKSTATEAVRLGARLATGTQVILEQAEHVIGGQFNDPVMAEAVQVPVLYRDAGDEGEGDVDPEELISRYADQPTGVREGVVSAYHSLKRNLNSAAQTILAVPMEVYERSGNEGSVRAVVRAVPIAVLRPMIGASEAVSKTLLGLHNTLDPNVRAENEAKYKQR